MTERTLDGDDLNYFEREVIGLVRSALQMPLSPRLAWFNQMALAMHSTNRQLGWDGKAIAK